MPTPTRLLLASIPPILRDIIRDAVEDVENVELVGDCQDEVELPERVARSRPDVVVAEQDGPGIAHPYLSLMYRHPRLRLLTISPDGRRAALYRLVLRRRLLADTSPQGLVEAIRSVARNGSAE